MPARDASLEHHPPLFRTLDFFWKHRRRWPASGGPPDRRSGLLAFKLTGKVPKPVAILRKRRSAYPIRGSCQKWRVIGPSKALFVCASPGVSQARSRDEDGRGPPARSSNSLPRLVYREEELGRFSVDSTPAMTVFESPHAATTWHMYTPGCTRFHYQGPDSTADVWLSTWRAATRGCSTRPCS